MAVHGTAKRAAKAGVPKPSIVAMPSARAEVSKRNYVDLERGPSPVGELDYRIYLESFLVSVVADLGT